MTTVGAITGGIPSLLKAFAAALERQTNVEALIFLESGRFMRVVFFYPPRAAAPWAVADQILGVPFLMLVNAMIL